MLIDVFQRYLAVFDLLQRETQNPNVSKVSLLDVGANGPGFAEYNHFEEVDQCNIDITDVTTRTKEKYPKVKFVTYAGEHLPFDDGCFDIVICVDVLEHIPPRHRKEFILDVIRVSKVFTIFAFPVKTSENWEKFLSVVTFGRIKFLQEHIANGLPREEDFLEVISALDHISVQRESGNLNVWLWIPLKLLSSVSYHLFKNKDDFIYESFIFYKKHVSRFLNWGKCYSRTYVLRKDTAN